jgi:hypothetical protein
MKTCLSMLIAVIGLAVLPLAADDTKSDSAGFVQLFNGKDLTGWKPHPDDMTKWEVKDGAITGSGPAGHLYSERGDYENFVFRLEAKINDGGNSGQYFRARFQKGFPPGYEAQINATHRDPIKTGSLYPGFVRGREKQAELRPKLVILECPHKPDEWFTQEVTADGKHIVIKVNGKTTVDFVDEASTYTKGHFAIQFHDLTCKIMVRKAEVKELPPSKK